MKPGLIVAIAAGVMVLVGTLGVLTGWRPLGKPPEAVAEHFVRELISGDYNDALAYMHPATSHEVDANDLRHIAIYIMMRSGKVVDVQGSRSWVKGGRALTTTRLHTSIAGDWALTLKMTRTGGSWAVSEIGSIQSVNDTESIFGTPIPTAIAALE